MPNSTQRARILEVLRGGPATASRIHSKTGIHADTIRSILYTLLSLDRVRKSAQRHGYPEKEGIVWELPAGPLLEQCWPIPVNAAQIWRSYDTHQQA